MRFIYAARSAGHYCYIGPVVDPISALGHDVEMLFHPDLVKQRYPTMTDLREGVCKLPGQTADLLLRRPSRERRRLEAIRNVLTYSAYLTREGQSDYYRRRWEQYLPPTVRRSLGIPGVRAALATKAVKSYARRAERRAPPDPGIVEYLREARPDAVIACPMNYWGSEEIEYVKAARTLGIPTVLPVFSWDNLTTKSLLYEIPDLVLVWNEKQVLEATEIHGVPPERIVISGAPHFDEILQSSDQDLTRTAFCAKAGIDPSRPYVLYLGSSSFIASDETWMVKEIASGFRNHPRPDVRATQLVVRPHPAHAKIYRNLEDDSIKVFPEGGGKLATPEFIPDFRNSLLHCEMAIGINTSGMFNAVVLDKPCATVIASRYTETQEEAMHFQHLIEADVLEVAQSPDSCGTVLARILDGLDSKHDARQGFVTGWIRPRGLHRPAGDVVAQAVVQLAQGKSPAEIDAILDEELLRADASSEAGRSTQPA